MGENFTTLSKPIAALGCLNPASVRRNKFICDSDGLDFRVRPAKRGGVIRMAQSFRLLAAFLAMLVQLGLPLSQAYAAEQGADLSTLICSPSGRTPSADAIQATQKVLEIAGKTNPDAPSMPPDCERCVTPSAALPTASYAYTAPTRFARPDSWGLSDLDAVRPDPRGPPCGTRAPPMFV